MSYTYTTWLDAIANLTAIDLTDPNFVANIDPMIMSGEQRLYRDLDLLSTVVRDNSINVTANQTLFTLPTALGRFVVLEAMNIITPAGSTTTNGTRNPLTPMSLQTLDYMWNTETSASGTVPRFFAMITDQTVKLGPSPGSAFNVECIGTIRPTQLSEANPTTFLTLYLPDLWLAATMIFMTGYMKNYGAQSDDPRSAISWQGQYDNLIQSANMENIRRKFGSVSWTAMTPVMATPERG
jgi:hypothetical protein